MKISYLATRLTSNYFLGFFATWHASTDSTYKYFEKCIANDKSSVFLTKRQIQAIAYSPCTIPIQQSALFKQDCCCIKEKKLWLDFVGYCFENLSFAPAHIKNDYEIVLEACRKNGLAIHFASFDLKNDVNIVKAAIEQNPQALQLAGDVIKNDKTFAIYAISQNVKCFEFISDALKTDPEIRALYLKIQS